MVSFGERLKTARLAEDLSVKDAARRLDVEPAQIRMWEADDRTPAPERQSVLLAALSVPAASPDMAEYQRGALWALGAMHETLGRLYRDLAQQPATIPEAAIRQLEELAQQPESDPLTEGPVADEPRAQPKRARSRRQP